MFRLLALAATAYAYCPNGCSGHGSCGSDDRCTCYLRANNETAWVAADCSERTCPKDVAWVKFPVAGYNDVHSVEECSNQGICDRKSGECDCFDGSAPRRHQTPGRPAGLGRGPRAGAAALAARRLRNRPVKTSADGPRPRRGSTAASRARLVRGRRRRRRRGSDADRPRTAAAALIRAGSPRPRRGSTAASGSRIVRGRRRRRRRGSDAGRSPDAAALRVRRTRIVVP